MALEYANIVADGCRDPLVVWGEILIDGHYPMPEPQRLFESKDAAHQELLSLFASVYADIKADGGTIPSFRAFHRDVTEAFKVWRLYA